MKLVSPVVPPITHRNVVLKASVMRGIPLNSFQAVGSKDVYEHFHNYAGWQELLDVSFCIINNLGYTL